MKILIQGFREPRLRSTLTLQSFDTPLSCLGDHHVYQDFVVMSVLHSILTGATYGAGNAYPSGAPDFTSGFYRGSCCSVNCVSLFHVIVLSFAFLVLMVHFV